MKSEFDFTGILSAGNKLESMIAMLLPAALANVPFHSNSPAVKRYTAPGFPVHLAVHEISPLIKTPLEYTQPHIHNDEDEVNLIVSAKNLVYKIQVGPEVFIVSNNAGIWIPKGVLHAANVIEGAGFFVTIRI